MQSVKACLIKILSATPFTKSVAVSLLKAVRKVYYVLGFRSRYKTDEKMILFEAFMGRQMSCSPKALYREMLSNEKYADFIKVWAFKNPKDYEGLLVDEKTVLVKYRSREYYKYCARAKYWINNFRMPEEIIPKKEQVYVQCWHGTPLKRLGYDIKEYNMAQNSTESQRKTYSEDAKRYTYVLSPSDFYTEKFTSAFHLKALGKEHVFIQKGYPRNDFLYTLTDEIIAELKKSLLIPEGKKVILYAPTWRDNQHEPGVGYTYNLGIDFDKLYQELSNEYIILFRAHYLVSNGFDFDKYQGFVMDVCQYDDINHLYAVSDLLITDYSSVFFDYANLKRPMIFYMYDKAEYQDTIRGFYIDLEELPGPIIEKEEELLPLIKQMSTEPFVYDECYKKFNETYNPYNRSCSKEVLEAIIGE